MEVIPKTFKFTGEEIEAMDIVVKALNKMYNSMTAEDYIIGYNDSEIGSAADLLETLHNYLIDNCNKITLD